MIRVFDCLALCQHDFKLTFDTVFWTSQPLTIKIIDLVAMETQLIYGLL